MRAEKKKLSVVLRDDAANFLPCDHCHQTPGQRESSMTRWQPWLTTTKWPWSQSYIHAGSRCGLWCTHREELSDPYRPVGISVYDHNEKNDEKTTLTVGKTLAMSWLPVGERARSTIIARRALYGVKIFPSYQECSTYPFAGSHIRFTTRSRVSLPPSFRAFVTDLEPCSLVENSRSPSKRWSRVMRRCFSEPCSRTAYND